MNIEQQLQELLIHHHENEVVEFKEARTSFDLNRLGKYFSALSNEANLKQSRCAWLVFGIDDDHKVVGTQFRTDKRKLDSLKIQISNETTNRLTFIEIHTTVQNDSRVVLFQIPTAPRGIPIAWKGHYYGRDGASLGALNIEEIERIRNQNVFHDWSAEICTDASIDDLSEEAIAVARQEYVLKNPKLAIEAAGWDTATFLNKAKLTIRGKITRAAILLLGKPESSSLLNPSLATITWILKKDRQSDPKDYEHFTCPLMISVEQTVSKIRNLKYRYMNGYTLFPEEVDQYDSYVMREALHNAIAHQDYQLGGKVSVVEFEDGQLFFSNMGSFIPGTVENVIRADAPEIRNRNPFLAEAMVNLNMIDTIGSGIRKMFATQRRRLFPLPDYEITHDRVNVTITGKVIDTNYARKLAEMSELSLEDVILLDRVQKRKSLTSDQATYLKGKNLIKGRKPNYYISYQVARQIRERNIDIGSRGLGDQVYKKLICDYLEMKGRAKRSEIVEHLLVNLPDVLNESQKINKVKNLLQYLKADGQIESEGKFWQMSKK